MAGARTDKLWREAPQSLNLISFYPETLVFFGVRSGTKPNKNFARNRKKRYQKN